MKRLPAYPFQSEPNGEQLRNLRSFAGSCRFVYNKDQRRMSRKVKFSNNGKKAKTRLQKIHTRIALARKDFLHKTTTTISQNHALVCRRVVGAINVLARGHRVLACREPVSSGRLAKQELTEASQYAWC